MKLDKNAGLQDLQQAASLQAWHIRQQLERTEFSPFQVAYFMNELAAAALDVSTEYINTHDIKVMMKEVKARVVTPRPRAKPPRKRKPPNAATSNNP